MNEIMRERNVSIDIAVKTIILQKMIKASRDLDKPFR